MDTRDLVTGCAGTAIWAFEPGTQVREACKTNEGLEVDVGSYSFGHGGSFRGLDA